MSQLDQALEATHALLTAVGETRWAEWISGDLAEWRASRALSHHLSAYGGMGSFTDLVISQVNTHRVTSAQEPWADALLRHLQSTCYVLARNHGRDLGSRALLSSYDGGPDVLTGWRCLSCGHSQTTPEKLESLLASRHLPRAIIERLQEGTLPGLVADVLELKVANVDADRQYFRTACEAARIQIVDRSDWMRPCPQCTSDDTAVYRWRANGGLTPAPDNLPLKPGAG